MRLYQSEEGNGENIWLFSIQHFVFVARQLTEQKEKNVPPPPPPHYYNNNCNDDNGNLKCFVSN